MLNQFESKPDMTIVEKVKKLLALSASPNEAEARAALLKAHELMGKYKLSEASVNGEHSRLEIIEKDSGISGTKQTAAYMFPLSDVIADATLTRTFTRRQSGSKIYKFMFVGFEEDVTVACNMITFITRFLTAELAKQNRYYQSRRTLNDIRRANLDGYALGFVHGLREALESQKDESDWGLVMVTPKEVDEYFDNMTMKTTRIKEKALSREAYAKGVKDGKNFNARGFEAKALDVRSA